LDLEFRDLSIEDTWWVAEFLNDAEAARYWEPFPRTEHETREWIRSRLRSGGRPIVAELDGEPVGHVGVDPEAGRCRHIAEIGIFVRRRYWGRRVGSALMREALRVAEQLGCRKVVLNTTEGNERAMRLYRRFGFKIDAYETDSLYIDGSWRREYFMSLQLTPCEPRIDQGPTAHPSGPRRGIRRTDANIRVRQLMDRDLDELNRLQNCPESMRSTSRVPPVTAEETRRWYEGLNAYRGRYCFACFEDEALLGYLQFRTGRGDFPSPNLWVEEFAVDIHQRPTEAAERLIAAIKGFRERYGYRRIFIRIPQTASAIIEVLESHGFNNTGAIEGYCFIDGRYVDLGFYEYPRRLVVRKWES